MTIIETGFRGYHPYVLFFYYVCVSILAMYLNHPLFLIVGCILLIVVNLIHDQGEALKKWIPLLFGMSTVIIICNALFVSDGRHTLFSFFGRKVTLEATVYGVVMALSIVLILLMFISFNLVLNGNKFLFVFSKFLPRTAFLTMLAIRFVPLLRMRLAEITDVQRIKGLTITVGTCKERVRNGMTLIQILLTWSLEEAVETADSMRARGYGIGKRSPYVPYKMSLQDKVWFILLLVLFIFCIVCGEIGYGRITIYPEMGTLNLKCWDVFLLLSTISIWSFPLLVEGRERLRWKYSN